MTRLHIAKRKSKKQKILSQKQKEDLEFARRTEVAYKRIEAGKYKRMSIEEFLNELKSLKRRK